MLPPNVVTLSTDCRIAEAARQLLSRVVQPSHVMLPLNDGWKRSLLPDTNAIAIGINSPQLVDELNSDLNVTSVDVWEMGGPPPDDGWCTVHLSNFFNTIVHYKRLSQKVTLWHCEVDTVFHLTALAVGWWMTRFLPDGYNSEEMNIVADYFSAVNRC